jgi:hypothetical protein
MSPRLLRPRQTGFNPRSISGLALWLDGADSSTTYTTDAGPVTAVTDPRDITGCALWLDGADSSAASMTLDGTAVSSWRDKSGNGRDFTATSTARPTLTASVINSRSAVTFNGSTNTLTGNAAAQDVIRNLAGYTVFTVLRTASIAAGERLAFGVGATVLFRTGQTDSRSFMGGRRVGADTLESVTGTASELSVGATFIQSAVVNHTTQSLAGIRNGATYAADTTYMAAGVSENVASSVSVGTQAGGTYGFWNGEIAEIIAFNSALTTTNRARVEAYLAAKWGVSGVHAAATATSDPVGYWGDKSGNGRHATQASGTNRPTLATASINSRNTVSFAGASAQRLGAVVPGNDSQLFTLLAVVRNATSGSGVLMGERGGNFTIALHFQNSGGNRLTLYPAGRTELIYPLHGGATVLYGTEKNSSTLLRGYYNGARTINDEGGAFSGYNLANLLRNIGSSTNGASPFTGNIAELIAYPSVLSDADRQRVERYLASKWGITLAPTASNADAQDWINRVYANGGTVSTSTAAAVNTFCNDIDAAVIRDRFYRLNLFCGNSDASLNAVRTPLYRGQSRTGTQYGDATDANNAFQQTDYAENNGLLGSTASSKWLNTGLNANTAGLTVNSMHLSTVFPAYSHPANNNWFAVSIINAAVNERFWLNYNAYSGNTESQAILGSGGTSLATKNIAATNGATIPGGLWVASRVSGTDLKLYNGNTEQASTAVSVTGAGVPTNPVSIFARWNGTSTFGHFGHRMRGYSVGLGMTPQQVSDYNTAMTTFQTALGRT